MTSSSFFQVTVVPLLTMTYLGSKEICFMVMVTAFCPRRSVKVLAFDRSMANWNVPSLQLPLKVPLLSWHEVYFTVYMPSGASEVMFRRICRLLRPSIVESHI